MSYIYNPSPGSGLSEAEKAEFAKKAEIATIGTDGTMATNSDERVPSEKATKTLVEQPQALSGVVCPDILRTPMITSGAIAVIEKKSYWFRCTIPKAGKLRDLNLWVSAKSGKAIIGVYDTGAANSGKYTRLAWGESEPASNTAWNKIVDPELTVTRGQQIMLMFVPNNSTITIGRGGAGAIATPSGQLPTSFIPAEGATPKLTATFTLGAFEAPTTVEEASLVSGADIPYVILGRVA